MLWSAMVHADTCPAWICLLQDTGKDLFCLALAKNVTKHNCSLTLIEYGIHW